MSWHQHIAIRYTQCRRILKKIMLKILVVPSCFIKFLMYQLSIYFVWKFFQPETKGNKHLYVLYILYIYINIICIIYMHNIYNKYIYNIYIIYVIMKTMCPPGYHHSGFVATHTLDIWLLIRCPSA